MVKNSLVQKKETFSAFIVNDGVKRRIADMLGSEGGQKFITSIVSAVSANPALAECENSTILSAALLGESLKLSPSAALGQFFLVPYADNKNGRKVATFQIGYKGYIQLAIRSGQYKKLNVLPIKAGELKKYDPLNEEIEVALIDDENEREKAPTIGYFAMFEYINGFKKTLYWSKAKMEKHANRYSRNSPRWRDDFDSMALKTMLRQLISKWGVMSVDMQTAVAADMSVVGDNGRYEYVENTDGTETETTENALNITPEPEPAPAKDDEKPEYTAGGKPIPDAAPKADFFFERSK